MHCVIIAFFQVIILCFALFYGGASPSSLWSSHAEYTTASGKYIHFIVRHSFTLFFSVVRSRSLLSVDPKINFCTKACDWFKQIFMREHFDYFELNRNNNYVTEQLLHNRTQYDIIATSILNATSILL